MTLYEELKKKIDKLEIESFDYYKINIGYEEIYVTKLLRRALLYYNEICFLKDKQRMLELQEKLSIIIKNKFKELNPSLNENILQDMLVCYKRGTICYPLDILVLDNGVFIKEGIIDDFGGISYTRTQMVENRYFNIFREFFLLCDSILDLELKQITNEQAKEISKFLSDSINSIFKYEYFMPITKPIYELNRNGLFYGVRGLVSNVKTLDIYINARFDTIANSIINQNNCTFELYYKDGEDISVYSIDQTFKDNKPIWTIRMRDLSVWCLSEEAIRQQEQRGSILTKKPSTKKNRKDN